MYCPTCGAQLAQALSYCNHCGANLGTSQVQSEAAGTAIDTLMWVIVGTTITLLGMALGALVLMKNGAIDERLGDRVCHSELRGPGVGRRRSSLAAAAPEQGCSKHSGSG